MHEGEDQSIWYWKSNQAVVVVDVVVIIPSRGIRIQTSTKDNCLFITCKRWR